MNKRGSKAGIYLLIVILLILLVSGSALAVIYLQSQKQIIPDTTSVDASDTSQPVISNDNNIPSNKLINAKHIYQLENWPTGCESVSAVMALNHAGINISVDDFIDNYLTCTNPPFNPYKSFGGNPRDKSGLGCYAPVIKEAVDKVLENTNHAAKLLSGVSLEELCKEYIAKDIPVIIWGTLDMAEPFEGKTWEFEGETFTWIRPEHCLLLIGYNEENYAFCDPMHEESVTYYPKAKTETAYTALHSQAIIIE